MSANCNCGSHHPKLTDEERAKWNAYLAACNRNHQPQGKVEWAVVRQLAFFEFRLEDLQDSRATQN